MKILYTLLIVILTTSAIAQKRNIYFLKNDGREVAVKDSTDYIRVVSEPDSGATLYNVIEYYTNGNRKLVAKSSDIDPLKYEGPAITFFSNGKRSTLVSYVHGVAVDTAYEYHLNGKISVKKHFADADTSQKPDYIDNYARQIIDAVYDTTGALIVKDGNGYYKGTNGALTQLIEQGELSKGLKEGSWAGKDEGLHVTFNETYSQGKLISGTVTDTAGHTTTYTNNRRTPVTYKNGMPAFYKQFIDEIYKEKKYGVNGNVIAKFYVTNTGKIENFQFITPIDERVEPSIRKAMSKCTDWIPATAYGRNIGSAYVIRLGFRGEIRTSISRVF